MTKKKKGSSLWSKQIGLAINAHRVKPGACVWLWVIPNDVAEPGAGRLYAGCTGELVDSSDSKKKASKSFTHNNENHCAECGRLIKPKITHEGEGKE